MKGDQANFGKLMGYVAAPEMAAISFFMARKISPKVIEAHKRAVEKDGQSALAASRRKTKVRQRARRLRTRRLIELGARAMTADLSLIHDMALRAALRDCSAELRQLEENLKAAGIEIRKRTATAQSRNLPESSKEPVSKVWLEGDFKRLRISFSGVPPEGLRAQLKKLKFEYMPQTKEWHGMADPVVVRSAIAQERAEHLLRHFREEEP